MIRKAAAAGVLSLLVASPAAAQVKLSLHDGRVTLVATNATVRQILTEWARIGQTKIVNVERIPGGPVTLQLTNVPEAEALDLLLKSVTGYLAAPRPATSATLSRYDRILVLPTPAVPRAPVVAAPAPAFQQPGARQPVDEPDDEGPSIVQPPRGPLFPTVQQQQQRLPQAGPPQPAEDEPGEPAQISPAMPQGSTAAPAVGQPFIASPGIAGAPRPGMVIAPPAQQPGPNTVVAQPVPD